MTTKHFFDICIIGGGAGGLSVASGAAQLGIKVALIETHLMGGDCLNFGCVPSKALLSSAKHYYNAVNSAKYGFKANPAPINIQEIMAKVKEAIEHIAPHDSVERFEGLGVKVFKGYGKFLSEKQAIVGDTVIEAKYFVIATGSSPLIPEIPGLDSIDFLTNETIFELAVVPKHLLVIGGGPIGCELAQAFAMFGVKVTLVEQNTILPKDETDLVAELRQYLQHNFSNLSVLENTTTTLINKEDGCIQVTVKNSTNQESIFEVSHILVAAGRRSNINNLDLSKAGILYTERSITVDDRLRTSNKKIFAVGDVTGSYQFTHIAGYHAGIVIRNILFRQRSKVNYKAVPWVTYTYPELAHVGLTLNEAKTKFADDFKVSEFSFSDNDRAVTEKQYEGKIKLITSKKGKILGVSILGPNAGELLAPWIDLLNRNEGVSSITKNIIPYPTLSDINKQVVGEYYKPILFTPKVRSIVKFLKFFW